jgi:PAS domain S-box-containing protein
MAEKRRATIKNIAKSQRAGKIPEWRVEDFQTIVSKNADAMIVLDHEGFVLYVNPATESLFNLLSVEMVGAYFGFPIILDKPVELHILRELKKFVAAEMRMVEVVWAGEPSYLLSFRDLTDRINAEQLTSKARDKLDAMVSERTRELSESNELLRREIAERKQAEVDREQLLARLKESSAKLENVNEELEVRSEELASQAEEIETTNEELRSNNEELQRVTESLQETSDYLVSMINNANASIIVWDPRFTITRFNRAFERLSGYTASEVIGRHLSMLFPKDSIDSSLDKIKKTLAGEQWESVEIPIQHKYEGIHIALWNSANIYDNDKELLATIAQGQDITERKRVESELAEAKAQAELYLDLMGHDISNLHHIMMMQLELAREILDRNGKIGCDDRDLIDIPVKTLEKASRLIHNVRKLQKLRSGEYSPEVIDLAKILEEVLLTYSDIRGRKIKVNSALGEGYLVLANPLLKDVFSNLVDNAVKHSSDPLEIGAYIHKIGLNGSSYYRVTIEDNGNGIPDDKKDEVFNRFKRGQTKARGTGLGLYLVKSLVESFDGYVEVQNRVMGDYTKGTRFLVYLPWIKADKDA